MYLLLAILVSFRFVSIRFVSQGGAEYLQRVHRGVIWCWYFRGIHIAGIAMLVGGGLPSVHFTSPLATVISLIDLSPPPSPRPTAVPARDCPSGKYQSLQGSAYCSECEAGKKGSSEKVFQHTQITKSTETVFLRRRFV